MQAIIKPGFLQGTVTVPPSKSMMQRACAGALLHKGRTIIHNPGKSEDDLAALQIIQHLGAKIMEHTQFHIVIESLGTIQNAENINCGESGLSARLFTPIAALSKEEVRIEGKGSLLKRTMNVFDEVLPQLNVSLRSFNGFIPFAVKGPLKPKNISVDGSISSQFLSGLLFAYCHAANQEVTITVTDLKSKPYIDLTLQMLAQFGWRIEQQNYSRFIIDPTKFENKSEAVINVEGDWSSAGYWLAGAAINGKVSVAHLRMQTFQADKKIVEMLEQAACSISTQANNVAVERCNLKGFKADLTDAPDLFPIAAILASYCYGESTLKGLHRLKHKESDRAKSIVDMLQNFGVNCSAIDDSLIIDGTGILKSATIQGYNDHRIVMAAAIGALMANGETIIANAEAVAKSYPDFFRDLAELGIHCELKN